MAILRLQCLSTVLILLVGMSTVSCYQPVDLNTGEAGEIPWVHCILSPNSTQWLELRYLSSDGSGRSRGINDAEITLYVVPKDDNPLFLKNFTNFGDGLWRLDSLHIQARLSYRLSIKMPGRDSIWAQTSMPAFDYDLEGPDSTIYHFYQSGMAMDYRHHSDVEFIGELDDDYSFIYEVNGRRLIGYADTIFDDETQDVLYNCFDKPRYKLRGYLKDSPLWIYKVGWSEKDQSWFIEEALTCNLEDRADGFNTLGIQFNKSREPDMLSAFPETENRPLHYYYLRFPAYSISENDTISISGDFSGPHYGDARPGPEIDIEKNKKIFYNLQGIPYDNIFTTGHAGYVNFKSVSYEYDRYLKDVAQFELLREMSSDIIGIYNNTNTYTNIHGGTGIFGAEVNSKLYWSCGIWIY